MVVKSSFTAKNFRFSQSKVLDLLNWILTKGQTFNEQLEYTRVPEDVAKKASEAVNNELKIRPY
ncbi:MAG: hypothetical protein U7127_01560 [Phormidium sp.]